MNIFKRLFSGNRIVCYLSLLLLGIIIIAWLAINRWNLQECIESYRLRNRELAKVKALKKRLEDYQEEKRLLETGMEENEIAVRNRFRMVRPGEHLVIVEREEPEDQSKAEF